ncbi:MAG: NADPH2:quinone reductase [Halieaceae bacterium]|jgi:NADPH2:quinone reductase
MKAVWFEKFGSAGEALQFGVQPTPEPKPGEVLVKVETTAINPSDVKKRAGAFPDLLDGGLIIPHSDGAGTIVAVGAGVASSRIGERVWVYQAQYGRRFGTAAQYVSVDDKRAPPLPDETSFEVGACLGIPAMTAHRCVLGDGPIAGQTILITGGAGRVGYYAIQWAKAAGAKVIATASNDADRDACLTLGADAVCNHREPDWGTNVLKYNHGRPVDRVVEVEFGTNLEQVLCCIRTGGTISTYSSSQMGQPQLPFVRMMFMDITIHLVIVYAMPEQAKTEALVAINMALERDDLKHRVAEVVPYLEMARAHEIIESGAVRGCVIARMSE